MIKKLLENLDFKETSKNIYKKQYSNHNNYEITILCSKHTKLI